VSVRRLVAPLLLAAALLPAAPAHGQVMVVTAPDGLAAASDPFPGFYSWFRDDMGAGSSAGITTDYARSGTGSMLLTGTGAGSKADLAMYFSPSAYFFTRLGNFAGLSYDFYRAGSSTAASHLAPALRLLVDVDGDPFTTDDRGSLVYEPTYNGIGAGAVPVDQWVSTSVGASTNLWFFQSGLGAEEVFNRTLADYVDGSYTSTSGFAHVTWSSVVYGMSFGTGGGWDGTYTGAVDNVTYELNFLPTPDRFVTYNFEPGVTATPEPASLALVGGGLLVLGGAALRRRRSA
jgi:hypothetical protein